MQIQSCRKNLYRKNVVICFKFSNFAYANTVTPTNSAINSTLLFALNLVTLLMQIQSVPTKSGGTFSCYLL